MRYEGRVYRPPSEGDAFILQATIGCSHNLCTYCDMYREKRFRVRPHEELLEDIALARAVYGPSVAKVFVADGDALALPTERWLPLLEALRDAFPGLRRVSCYATARNVLEKTPAELERLRRAGLDLLYIGPESGDPLVLKRIVKGAGYEEHVAAAARAHAAGLRLSAIFLLGAGGVDRSREHAEASARLASDMDPEFLAALTLTIVPGTPLARLAQRGGFRLPDVRGLLRELRTFVAGAEPSDALFRTNHASNYLPLGGRLPADRERILTVLDRAIAGEIPLRPEAARGL
ncbi:MAG: radical SAM protein [Planctomycetota bacterium]|nr:MAG: radical SAM protein [Planctomycetota bacterium]